jgi:glycine/D-amino acid oxidase-like deaminating enzyme
MITSRHRLRHGESVWQANPPSMPETSVSKRDIRCDALIVGAGICGAIMADAFANAGFSVVVVDRRGVARGSTVASTAMLQYDLDLPLHLLARRLGGAAAQLVWQHSFLALTALRLRISELGVRGGARTRSSLYLAGDLLDGAGLQRELKARAAAGLVCSYLSSAEVGRQFGIHGRPALLTPENMAADPIRLTRAFLAAATQRGARICAPLEVTGIKTGRRGVRTQTSQGTVITSRHVVLATGYERLSCVPAGRNAIASTWAIATRPQPARIWKSGSMIWEASRSYTYLRTDAAGRIICGGADEEFVDEARRDALLPQKTRALERKLARLLPGVDARAQWAWCGSFGTSPTGMPTIGAVPGLRNCYAAMCYGGNGTTFAMLAAQLLLAHLRGERSEAAQIFGFKNYPGRR